MLSAGPDNPGSRGAPHRLASRPSCIAGRPRGSSPSLAPRLGRPSAAGGLSLKTAQSGRASAGDLPPAPCDDRAQPVRRLPKEIIHSDWSVSAGKRRAARAVLREDPYHASEWGPSRATVAAVAGLGLLACEFSRVLQATWVKRRLRAPPCLVVLADGRSTDPSMGAPLGVVLCARCRLFTDGDGAAGVRPGTRGPGRATGCPRAIAGG